MVLEKTIESPLASKEIKPVNPKEHQPWIFIGRIVLELRFQLLGHLMRRVNSLEKTLMLGRMVGWHHRLNGHEFEQTPGKCEGQGNLVYYSAWGHKESDTTERLHFISLHFPYGPTLISIHDY